MTAKSLDWSVAAAPANVQHCDVCLFALHAPAPIAKQATPASTKTVLSAFAAQAHLAKTTVTAPPASLVWQANAKPLDDSTLVHPAPAPTAQRTIDAAKKTAPSTNVAAPLQVVAQARFVVQVEPLLLPMSAEGSALRPTPKPDNAPSSPNF